MASNTNDARSFQAMAASDKAIGQKQIKYSRVKR
jgi:hypothetical protein